MATLRLFAGLRDAAGTSRVEMPGSTVDEVLEGAVDRFGPGFAAGLAKARVWVNGEEAMGAHAVAENDEVALIPPVSGGSGVMTGQVAVSPGSVLAATIAIVLIAANVWAGEAVVAAAIVGAAAVWAVDVATVITARGRDLPVVPVLATILVAVVATRTLGATGLALTVGAAVVAPLVWGVASETARLIQIIAPTVVVSLLAGLATASLLHVRFTQAPEIFGVFLVVVISATVAGVVAERLRGLPFGDPFTLVAIVAIGAALAAAAIWDLPLTSYLFVGVVMALGMVAGKALGSILRTGASTLVESPPGLVAPVDGSLMAACLLVPILALLG
ncbi:MAG: MoaD/ThiS family protein [Acidimicrobiia bacterium]|nr:MoaD/ThiS family protein [Acidimicrobiia bacterium]MDH5295322.1 MoaD/ThiS family protein [Acidimicrobiia bacterium]